MKVVVNDIRTIQAFLSQVTTSDSLCTDVPPSQKKSGEETPPEEGWGASVHRLDK